MLLHVSDGNYFDFSANERVSFGGLGEGLYLIIF